MGYGAHGACHSRCRWGTLGPRRWPGALSHARSGQVRFHTPGRLLSETSSSSWRRRPRGGAGAAPSAGVSMSPHPDFLAPPTGTLCHRTTKRARRQSGARAWWRLGGATHRFLVLILLRLPAPRGANSFLLPHGAIEVVRLHRVAHGARPRRKQSCGHRRRCLQLRSAAREEFEQNTHNLGRARAATSSRAASAAAAPRARRDRRKEGA